MYVHRSVDKGFLRILKTSTAHATISTFPSTSNGKSTSPSYRQSSNRTSQPVRLSLSWLAKNDFKEFIDQKKCDISWNFGVGLEFFSHLQVGASYGLGLTNALEKINVADGTPIEGKNKYWTITAAYLF